MAVKDTIGTEISSLDTVVAGQKNKRELIERFSLLTTDLKAMYDKWLVIKTWMDANWQTGAAKAIQDSVFAAQEITDITTAFNNSKTSWTELENLGLW